MQFKRQFYLIKQLTIANFKLRNEGSYLGILWYLLNPLLTFLVLYFLFSNRLGQSIEHYPLYLLIGIIQWNFFSLTISLSMRNIISNSQMIKSLNFRQETLIISSSLMALLTHFFELIIFIIFLLFSGIVPILAILFPLIIILQFLFVLGLSFAFSAIIIYFRDLDNVWSFLSRLWWFATPIFYSISAQTPLIYFANLLNPLYYIITISRDLLIYNKLPSINYLLALTCFSLASLVIGYIIFRKLKNKISERV